MRCSSWGVSKHTRLWVPSPALFLMPFFCVALGPETLLLYRSVLYLHIFLLRRGALHLPVLNLSFASDRFSNLLRFYSNCNP